MRIHVLSDLHLEGAPFEPPAVAADVVVLAGDISTGARGVDWAKLSLAFDGRPVLYVAGNHEFYGESFPALFGELRAASDSSVVRVLENDELVIGGVRFLGCTLWSDFCFDGPGRQSVSMALCGQVVNDYRQIRGESGNGELLTPRETLERHVSSRAWLAERLAAGFDGPTVVITHHAPLIRRRPPSEVLRLVAGAFASDLSELMGGDRVALWIYGHTHQPADLDVEGTRVVSNPRGYARESIAAFDPAGVYYLRTI